MKKKLFTGLVLPALALIGGCRLISGIVAFCSFIVVGTAGLVGFTVYKSGEAVVDGGKSVATAVGDLAKSDDKTDENKNDDKSPFVYSHGILKTKEMVKVTNLYKAFLNVVNKAGFKIITKKHDQFGALIKAETAMRDNVTIKLELLEENLTSIQIQVGRGNIKQSEFIYNQAIKNLLTNKGAETK